jgi:cyclophilin family peptidyl-prolyl cis-trans isomerase
MNPTNIKSITILFLLCAVLVVGLSLWIGGRSATQELPLLDETQNLDAPLSPEALKADNQVTKNTMNPKAVFTTSKGTFELELFEDQMPITVGNFVKLAEEGFYDGTKFHRVIDGFMVQGGDPNTKTDNTASYGQGGPGYTIQDEFVAAPNLSNVRGSISMANTGQPNSGGSQFFINTVDNLGLDFDKDPAASKHPVFGHVVKGMDVVDAIEKVETDSADVPSDPLIITSVTITRN